MQGRAEWLMKYAGFKTIPTFVSSKAATMWVVDGTMLADAAPVDKDAVMAAGGLTMQLWDVRG